MKDSSRLLILVEYLHRNTDKNHYETTSSILNFLEEQGCAVDRKTLNKDLQILIDIGIGIEKEKSSPNRYFWSEKLFKRSELQMLADAVMSSKFISQRRSRELVEKISYLTSVFEADRLKNQSQIIRFSKADNIQLYETVDIIAQSIENHKSINFKYIEYNRHKKKVYRNEGKEYDVSPYKLFWNEDNYYIIGWCGKHNDITVFRVDRMEDCSSDNSKYVDAPETLNLDDYTDKYFSMFDGEEIAVRLEVDNELMKYIIDRFGADVSTNILTEDTFSVDASVRLSPVFYGWIFQFNGGIRIIGPESVVTEYRNMVRNAYDRMIR